MIAQDCTECNIEQRRVGSINCRSTFYLLCELMDDGACRYRWATAENTILDGVSVNADEYLGLTPSRWDGAHCGEPPRVREGFGACGGILLSNFYVSIFV